VSKNKNANQDAEAKMKTSKDHAEGKPSSKTPKQSQGDLI
jgi:hypothetical protein